MDAKTLDTAAKAIDALDLSDLNARAEAINAEIAHLQEAILAAEARRGEIIGDLANWRGPDAVAVADALLATGSPRDAVAVGPNREALTQERDTLGAAMRELQSCIDERRRDIADIEGAAFGRLSEAVAPMAQALAAEARQAAQSIVDSFVALSAINLATRAGRGEVDRLQRTMEAIAGGGDSIVPFAKRREVDSDTLALLARLEGKGPALPCRVASAVHMP